MWLDMSVAHHPGQHADTVTLGAPARVASDAAIARV
jgi:hypothetical protein